MEKPPPCVPPGLGNEYSLKSQSEKLLSFKLEDMTLSEKSSKRIQQLTEVLPMITDFLDGRDLLSLRIVCHEWKSAVDQFWIEKPKRSINMAMSHLPTISLDSRKKLAKFVDDMQCSEINNFWPIPILLHVGLDMNDEKGAELLSERQVKLFWKEAYMNLSKIGERITAIKIGVRIHDNFRERVAKDTVKVVMECLQTMPNLEYLMIHLNTVRMENRFAEYYKENLLPNANQKLPTLDKLKTFEFRTFGQESHGISKSKPAEFPVLFLRQHGHSLNTLILMCKLNELKNMEPLQVPNLRTLELDIHHCSLENFEEGECDFAELPFVSAGKDCLENLKVTLSWTWRKCDLAGVFNWLSKYYSDYTLRVISLIGLTHDDDESSEDTSWDYWDEEDEIDIYEDIYDSDSEYHSYFSWPWTWTQDDQDGDENENEQCNKSSGAGSDESKPSGNVLDDGNDFFSWSWARGLKLPKVKNIMMSSVYKGSLAWVRGLSRDALETILIMDYRCEVMVVQLVQQEELLKKLWSDGGNGEEEGAKAEGVEEEKLIWDYFPKLEAVMFVWPIWEQKSLNFRSGKEEFEKYINRSARKNL